MMSQDNPDTEAPQAGAGERIAKAIARAGLCSRRDAENWIAAGRVAVNGAVIASPALTVTAQDRIEVDGKPLPERERTRLFLYHKPGGLVTTTADPEGRPTIFSALPANLPRLVSVGRLDINTEGLLLLTNDGGLARLLELPTTGWLRRYRVRAHGRVAPVALARLRDGITLDGVAYGPIEASLDREQGANVWLTMAIREGKNREIRKVVEALGLQANRLIRVSFGPFQLGELRAGEVVEIKTRVLREQLGERIAAEAGCDFSAPIVQRAADEQPKPSRGRAAQRPHRPARKMLRPEAARTAGKRLRARDDDRGPRRRGERPGTEPAAAEKPLGRPRRGHAWRAEDAPLSRHYRGAGSKAHAPANEERAGKKRAGLIADRKGRRVLVERFGEKKESVPKDTHAPPNLHHQEDRERLGRDKQKPRRGRPAPRDRPRASGPRPSRPKPR